MEIVSVCLEIMPPKSKSFFVMIFYRPPDTSKYLHKHFNDFFADMLLNISDKETITLGDINVNFLKRENNQEFKSILQLNGFKQIIKDPTRIDGNTKSLIDIIATNNLITIRNTAVIPCGIADHDMIGCVRKVLNKRPLPNKRPPGSKNINKRPC